MKNLLAIPRWLDHVGLPLVLGGSLVLMLATVAS